LLTAWDGGLAMVNDNNRMTTGLPKPRGGVVNDPAASINDPARQSQQVYDSAAVTLRRAYDLAKGANLDAARDLPRDLRDRLQDAVLRPCDAVVGNANTLPMLLGPAQIEETITTGPDGRQQVSTRRLPVAPDLFMVAALRNKLEVPAQLAGVADAAAQIVADAAAAAVPAVPPLAGEQEVAAREQHLTHLLAAVSASTAAGVAMQLLDTAMREGDQLTLHVLLGDRLRYVYAAVGVQVGQLRTRYIASLPQQPSGLLVDASPTAPVELGGFRLAAAPGVAFARLQSAGSDQRLADLPRLARAYWDAQWQTVRGLLDLGYARAHGLDVSGL
jgi:hypothetical protein